MIRFRVELTMMSDWRIGTGFGRQGSVDSLAIRDADGLPYVPSSTVSAMWRDAAEQLAFGLDQREGSDGWTSFASALFGNQPSVENVGGSSSRVVPAPSRLSVPDLHFAESLRDALVGGGRTSLRQALSFVKPGLKIDPRRGTALTDFLRFEEMCRAGAVLTGTVSVDTRHAEEHADTVAAFALAALRLVERIGGNRRRGAGKCAADAAEVDGARVAGIDAALERLEGYRTAPAIAPLEPAPANATAYTATSASSLIEVPLLISALSPLLILNRRLGNVTTCHDHVPGTMLLPLVSRSLRNVGVDSERLSGMITSGSLSVTPAYPAIEGRRGLPAPMCWEWPKSSASEASAVARNASIEAGDTDNSQMVSPRGGLFFAGGNVRSVGQVVRTHNTVADDVQKPSQEVGGVYSYEAIRTGETLASVVRLPAELGEEVVEAFEAQIVGEAALGAVLNRGYGRARIERFKPGETISASHSPSNRAVLWLTSDFCLPVPVGAPGSALGGGNASVREQLAAAVGRSVGRSVKVVGEWLRTRRQDSWHRRWGLPRPSLSLVVAGSVIVIEPGEGGEFSARELDSLETHGVGARRAEGFGRLRVNASETTQETIKITRWEAGQEATARSDAPVVRSGAMRGFAHTVETAAWRAFIAVRCEAATASAEDRKQLLGWTRDEPTASQLGKMRSLLNGARTPNDVDAVKQWLAVDTEGKLPEGWKTAGPELVNILNDPFAALDEMDGGTGSADAPSALTRSLEEIRGDEVLRRFAIAALLGAALRAQRRDSETPAPDPALESEAG